MKKFLIAAAATLALAGCGGGGDSADITGAWTGTASGVVNGAPLVQTINLALSQNGTVVNGTFNSTSGNTGSVTGTFNGSSFEGNLIPSVPNNCPGKFVLFYSNNKLEGSSASYNCTVAFSSTISIRR